MIFILHGDNGVFLRDLVFKLQTKLFAESRIEKEISSLSPAQLAILVSSFDIFSAAPFIVLDITKAGAGDKSGYVEAIKAMPAEANLVLLSFKQLPKNSVWLKNFDKAKVFENNIEPDSNVFKFLDQLFTKNRAASYAELHKLLVEGQDPFYIFSMILYSLRNVAGIKFDAPTFAKLQPFIRSKFERQAGKFSEDALTHLYSYFAELDKKVKLGQLSSDNMLSLVVEKILV